MAVSAKVTGRMMLKRVMGKASFCTLQNASFGPTGGRIQVYVKGADLYAAFKRWDLGDIVAAESLVFKTRTSELSIHATSVRLLTKSLRPMPDKFHGINDQEVKYRQRYIDLMTDETARKRFVASTTCVSSCCNTAVWRWRRPCCTPYPAVPMRGLLPSTTTRWTRRCFCASPRSFISSA